MENEGDADDEMEKIVENKKRKRKSVSMPKSKSKFKQMVQEEKNLEEDKRDESFDNELNLPDEFNRDGDDEESASESNEFCSDSCNDFEENLWYNDCSEQFSDNSSESEWEVSDFLTTDESDNEWKP